MSTKGNNYTKERVGVNSGNDKMSKVNINHQLTYEEPEIQYSSCCRRELIVPTTKMKQNKLNRTDLANRSADNRDAQTNK